LTNPVIYRPLPAEKVALAFLQRTAPGKEENILTVV